MKNIQREITPIEKEDLFILLNRNKAKFDYPVHFHTDYELNLVLNTSGKRIVGDSIEYFEMSDLVLLGPGLPHAWKANTLNDTQVITIQFHEEIHNSFLLSKRIYSPIYELLERSKKGVVFGGFSFEYLKQKILLLSQSNGFNATLDFFRLLFELANSENQRLLTSSAFESSLLINSSKSKRIEKICNYIEENYQRVITLSEIANLVNMSESAVSHFFKKRTYRSFVGYLTEIRIGKASKLLSETTCSISDVCYQSGFENISNFNRTFKKYKHLTPTEYRSQLQEIITI